MSLNLAKYDPDNMQTVPYNRDNDWLTTPSPANTIYLYKNAELKPHFKVYHSAGKVIDGSNKYDIVPQGVFYIDDFTIQEFGDSSINSIDSSKFLMETLCPDLIYNYAPATSVLMGILDSIGFTSYNFNVVLNNSNQLTKFNSNINKDTLVDVITFSQEKTSKEYNFNYYYNLYFTKI